MTGSSSEENPEMAQMAGELFQAKIEAAKGPQNLTHLLKLGSFHMEIVPDKSIDIEQVFKNTINDLYEKFGEEVLKINMSDIIAAQQKAGNMHG